MYNIYFNPSISHEFKSNEFDNHAYQFQDILKQLICFCANSFECTALFTEWMKIFDGAAYH